MLRVIEGYDWLVANNAVVSDYLLSANSMYWVGSRPRFLASTGLFGGTCLNNVDAGGGGTGNNPPAVLLQGVSVAEGFIGARVYQAADVDSHLVLAAYDTAGDNAQICVAYANYGIVQVWRGLPWRGGTLLAQTPPGAFFYNVWHYLEVHYVIDPAVGSVRVKINAGVPAHLTGIVVDLTNVNTKQNSSGISDGIGFSNHTTGGSELNSNAWDDVYMCDTTGPQNNSFLGNVRVQMLKTNGPGANTQLIIGGSAPAATNWQSVQDWPLDEAQFVKTPTTGNYDLYTVAPMVNTGPVFGVQVRGAMRQDDATEIEGQNLLYSSGVQGTTTPRLLNETQAFYKDIIELDPNTAAAWLAPNVNAVQIGVLKAA